MNLINKENSLFISPNRINLTSKDVHALDTSSINFDDWRSRTIWASKRLAEFANQFGLATSTLSFKDKKGKSARRGIRLREDGKFCFRLMLTNDMLHGGNIIDLPLLSRASVKYSRSPFSFDVFFYLVLCGELRQV